MARFQVVLGVNVEASNAIEASGLGDRILTVGTDHGYFIGGDVRSVEPVAVPIYTQAQLDKAVADAVAETAAAWATRVNSNA